MRQWMIGTALAWGAVALPQDGPPGATETAAEGPLTEDEKIAHLLRRFTPGITADLFAEVKAKGWRPWLQEQLQAQLPESEQFQETLKNFESLGLSLKEIAEKYQERPRKDASPRERAEARRKLQMLAAETLAWVIHRAVSSRNAVRETACDFFRNHFTVSIEKGQVRHTVVDWEKNVIFQNALGNFGEMLEASAKHPAMLIYLDNALSRRPATPEELRALESRVRRRTGSEERAEEAVELEKQRGLNENYARELLELHTLGVDRYYRQQDVIEVAKCLTGWTIERGGAGFRFNPRMHCPGDKTFLGQTIPENRKRPIAEGEMVLDILKKHEGTARFLSWKLCRWLVNDEPDESMVKRVAGVFHETGGDLRKVLWAIADDPAFFARENYLAKFKRPWEFVVSALRATGAKLAPIPVGLNRSLTQMNEPLYRCPDPTGYYDQAEAWRDPGALAIRWTFASDLVNGRIPRVTVPAALYDSLPPDRPEEWKGILAARILPGMKLSSTTSSAIDRMVEEERKKRRATPESVGRVIVAALLGSPEFQKQ